MIIHLNGKSLPRAVRDVLSFAVQRIPGVLSLCRTCVFADRRVLWRTYR